MDLNGIIALILRYFTELDRSGGVTMFEDRPGRFCAEHHFPVIFWPKLTHTAAARSLCNS